MNHQILPEAKKAYTARSVMGAPPLVTSKTFVRDCIATPEQRIHLNENITMDQYIDAHMNASLARINEMTKSLVDKTIANSEFQYRFNTDTNTSNVRLNDYGEFMKGGLTQVVPFVSIQPTRGISFQTMPLISV